MSIRSIEFHRGSHCNKELPYNAQTWLKQFATKDQFDSFNAMHELLCSYKDGYGIGEKFCLQTALESNCRFVTVEKTIGEGGSKKAVLLDDGNVAMFPNMDVNSLVSIASWWPENANKEASMVTCLETIGVPALNRRKAYILVKNKVDENISYKLPILLSDSFEQYASRGWFVYDHKNPPSNIYSAQEKWNFNDPSSLRNTMTPLIMDIWKIVSNGIIPGEDARNAVLIKTDQDSFSLRYLGFDFGGKVYSYDVPSLEKPITEVQWDHSVCTKVSEIVKDIIGGFVYYRILNSVSEEELDYKKINGLADKVGKYFSNCDVIKTEIVGVHNTDHTEL